MAGVSSLSALTISAWTYSLGPQVNYANIVNGPGNNVPTIAVNTASGDSRRVWLDWNTAEGLIDTGYDLPDTTWTFLTATFDTVTGDVIFYVNGSQVYSTTTSAISVENESGYWSIGGAYYNDPRIFDGTIDEVWIWNRSLSPSEVSELYNSGAGLQYPFTQ
jgi:hypothetical protein